MSENKLTKSSIYEKIEAKGHLEAQEILRVGQEKAKAMEDSIISNAQKEIAQLMAKSNERSKERIRTKVTEFEQAAKQRSLQKKKELIDEVFENVHQQLMKLSDSSLVEWVVKMIKNDVLKGDEIVKVSKNDYQRYVKLFSSGRMVANYILMDKLAILTNGKYQLRLANEFAEIEGGFIIEGSSFDIDHSFETMLENMKEESEAELAKMLFDGE